MFNSNTIKRLNKDFSKSETDLRTSIKQQSSSSGFVKKQSECLNKINKVFKIRKIKLKGLKN